MATVVSADTPMDLAPGPRRAGLCWLAQVATGGLLLGVVGLHMVAQHFVAAGGLRDFRDVLSYIGNPIVLFLELVLLVSVTAHGLLGVRAILLDFGPSARVTRLLEGGLLALGVGTLAYGLWLAAMLQRLR